jgi:threonine aldolase
MLNAADRESQRSVMNFASDNWAGAAPQIVKALGAAANGFAPAYGASDLDKRVGERFSELFEREVAVLFVATGSAANALALSVAMKPGGIVLAHEGAHVVEDECGGPELFSGGRIETVGGANGRIDPAALAERLKNYDPPFLHHGRAVALTLTQATEAGTVYTTREVSALAKAAHRLGLQVHMDGARFANALAALGCSPAEATWKAGIDLLSFGGTKNGCWCAEALILFHPGRLEDARYLHKRSAQLFSKTRFVAAQFDAYLRDGLWLKLAGHANAMADRLRAGIARSKRARLAWDTQANEVFAIFSSATKRKLEAAGARFYAWHTPKELAGALAGDEAVYRFVASFATQSSEIAALIRALS